LRLSLLLAAGVVCAAGQEFRPSLNDPALHYYADTQDAVTALQARLDKGSTQLEFHERWGYLESVLRELKVPLSSQTLVFSKTSLQVAKISPEHPRALYFSDELYVGLVRGGLLEVAVAEPGRGAVFYVLEQKKSARPRFVRKTDECLQCHFTSSTMQVPGFLARSVYTTPAGDPIPEAGAFVTDHRSPLRERWGGWFVTGTHGADRHMGNEIAKSGRNRIDVEHGANVSDLKGRTVAAWYPSPHSDLLALMVLNHQLGMHNLITRMDYEARLGRPELPATIEAALRYLLFTNEAQLRDGAKGTSPFGSEFAAQGPTDRKGRSLRQLDMQHRLFRYPCSFLIYSDSFEGLPASAKEPFYRRLWEVLSGTDQSAAFAGLRAEDRRAILEILVDTKKGLPEYFRAGL